MKWDEIKTIISRSYEVLVEQYPTRRKYFLIQDNVDYVITVKQFERIQQTDTLQSIHTTRNINGITEYRYYSKT